MTMIREFARHFPQLYIKPEAGASQSERYRAIVRKGLRYTGDLNHFIGSEKDSLAVEHTPVGEVMVVFLQNRADFECFYRIMACRCEPIEVPATMGACCLSGVNDWRSIHAHMDAYHAAGGEDPKGEFARFTADPSRYKKTMLILSSGPYSAVAAERTPYAETEWLQLSREIRKYHELTHFVCRKRFPEKVDPLWDELLADCMGLVFATGVYDLSLAQAFLGIRDGAYIGGRLENYTDGPPDNETLHWVTAVMAALAEHCRAEQERGLAGYALMEALEQQSDAICAHRSSHRAESCGRP